MNQADDNRTNQVVRDEIKSDRLEIFCFVKVTENQRLDRVGNVQVIANGLLANGLKHDFLVTALN